MAPADVNADLDSFQDKDRQKTLAQALQDDLSKAPWQKESAKGPLKDLWEKIAKVAKPIYEGFWCDRDQDIISHFPEICDQNCPKVTIFSRMIAS